MQEWEENVTSLYFCGEKFILAFALKHYQALSQKLAVTCTKSSEAPCGCMRGISSIIQQRLFMELLPNYPLNVVIIFFFCMCALNRFLNLEAKKKLGGNVCLDDKNTPLWESEFLSAIMCFINITVNWQTVWLRHLWKSFFFFLRTKWCLVFSFVRFYFSCVIYEVLQWNLFWPLIEKITGTKLLFNFHSTNLCFTSYK